MGGSSPDSGGGSSNRGRGAVPSRQQQRERAMAEQRRQKEARRKQEEAMMRLAEAEDDYEKASATQIDESNEQARENQRKVAERESGFFARSSSGNFIRSSSGDVVVSRAGQQARENIRAGFEGREARDMSKETIQAEDQTPLDTGESSPEVVDDDAGTAATMLTKKTRRTRGKRFGGAGDFGEGVLLRNTTK